MYSWLANGSVWDTPSGPVGHCCTMCMHGDALRQLDGNRWCGKGPLKLWTWDTQFGCAQQFRTLQLPPPQGVLWVASPMGTGWGIISKTALCPRRHAPHQSSTLVVHTRQEQASCIWEPSHVQPGASDQVRRDATPDTLEGLIGHCGCQRRRGCLRVEPDP